MLANVIVGFTEKSSCYKCHANEIFQLSWYHIAGSWTTSNRKRKKYTKTDCAPLICVSRFSGFVHPFVTPFHNKFERTTQVCQICVRGVRFVKLCRETASSCGCKLPDFISKMLTIWERKQETRNIKRILKWERCKKWFPLHHLLNTKQSRKHEILWNSFPSR